MNNLKYWYIDDENGMPEQSTVRMLNSHNVEVEKFNLKDSTDFGILKNQILSLSKEKNFGGLILDLRLDGNGDHPTAFNATALAQELRSVSARGETPIYPIILTSTDEKIKETYNNDKTSHDLFDYKIYKSSENWIKRSVKLNALAEGYRTIEQVFSKKQNTGTESLKLLSERLEGILNKKAEEIDNSRLKEKLLEIMAQKDMHFVAHFIIKQMFHFTSPLLNKRILFAKLGLCFDDVIVADREKVFEFFKEAKYSGVFSMGWERWWEEDINKIIKDTLNSNFSFISANKRVEVLNSELGTSLIAAEKLEHSFSDEYSSICEATKRPLDHLEGFKIVTSHDYLPWQTPKYLSLFAIINRIKRKEIKPHPCEQDKINQIRKDLELI